MRHVLLHFRRFLRFLRTAWSIAGLTLLAIVLVESGFRLIFWVKDHFAADALPDQRVIDAGYGGESWPALHYRELQALEHRWQPYVYFRPKPFSGQTITIDREGLRRTWTPPSSADRPAKVFKLLFLGGSALWGYGARDDWTIPSLVAREMYDRGYRVELRNLGEIGYVTTQEVIALLQDLQTGYRPDLVILYDGVNDTTSAWIEGEAGVTTNEQNRREEFNLLQSPSRLAASLIVKLVRDSASYRFAQMVGRRLGGSRDVPDRSTSAKDTHVLAAEVVRRYRANVALVEKLGKEFGFQTLFYLQPVVFDKRELTPFESDEARKFEWARGFFTEVYGAIRSSTDVGGDVHFHDLSQLFAGTPELIFIDYCHTTESGNRRIAEGIARDAIAILPPTDPRGPGSDRATGPIR
jgi:lysophospholipase L1-like esterase